MKTLFTVSVGGDGSGWEQLATLHRDEHLRHSLRLKTAAPQSKGGAVVSSVAPPKQSRTCSAPPPAFPTEPLLQIPANSFLVFLWKMPCNCTDRLLTQSLTLTVLAAIAIRKMTVSSWAPHTSSVRHRDGHRNRWDNLRIPGQEGDVQPAPLHIASLRMESPTRI